jgi:hypothetical protein
MSETETVLREHLESARARIRQLLAEVASLRPTSFPPDGEDPDPDRWRGEFQEVPDCCPGLAPRSLNCAPMTTYGESRDKDSWP